MKPKVTGGPHPLYWSIELMKGMEHKLFLSPDPIKWTMQAF